MRIGINVPDELLKELKQVRPEVNVSQVCRGALADRVDQWHGGQALTLPYAIAMHEATAGGGACSEARPSSVAKPPIEPDWEAYALDRRESVGSDGYPGGLGAVRLSGRFPSKRRPG